MAKVPLPPKMPDEPHEPTQGEMNMAASVEGVSRDLIDGNVLNVGVCGIRADGVPFFFYFDKVDAEREALVGPINQLFNLYKMRNVFAGNAPVNNRSYGTH